jgi:hypothetical protein
LKPVVPPSSGSCNEAGPQSSRAVEQGTHAALAKRPGGIYRGLFERQVKEFDRTAAAG